MIHIKYYYLIHDISLFKSLRLRITLLYNA